MVVCPGHRKRQTPNTPFFFAYWQRQANPPGEKSISSRGRRYLNNWLSTPNAIKFDNEKNPCYLFDLLLPSMCR